MRGCQRLTAALIQQHVHLAAFHPAFAAIHLSPDHEQPEQSIWTRCVRVQARQTRGRMLILRLTLRPRATSVTFWCLESCVRVQVLTRRLFFNGSLVRRPWTNFSCCSCDADGLDRRRARRRFGESGVRLLYSVSEACTTV